ncbi:MAG: penicillin-binding protein activator LpoB [Flavobacteriales bacterium]
MKRILIAASAGIIALTSLQSCKRTVTRVDAEEVIDLSGRWNDTDARLAAEELVFQSITADWINEYRAETGKKPVIIVGLVRNKSHEHISAETIIKEIEKEYVKSGKAKIVQGGAMRDELRAERADQQTNSSRSTVKKFGLEKGADFMLQGTINSTVDSYKSKKVTYYEIDLELTNIQTNEKVWFGDKKIKKFVKN